MPRIVVLGTGTDVGKTYVTAQLANALAAHPSVATVLALKPIESGVQNSPVITPNNAARWPYSASHGPEAVSGHGATDATLLALASSPPLQTVLHAYAFPDAVSPHMAARRSNATIDITAVANWVRRAEQTKHALPYNTLYDTLDPAASDKRAWTLVETAGAALSPLAKGVTNLDLALQLEPALWILVAPDRLGVLHDLTVTLCALRHSGRLPDSLILCQSANPDPSTGTNARELHDLDIAEVDATIERGASMPAGYIDRLMQLADARHA